MSQLVRWGKWLVNSKQSCYEPADAPNLWVLELPPDLVDLTFAFLTGHDLLPLSHACRQLYFGLLASEGEMWQRLSPSQTRLHTLQLCAPPEPDHSLMSRFRLGHHDTPPTAKQRYFARRALRFNGGELARDRWRPQRRGGAIPTPSIQDVNSGGSFSLDLVFALLPAPDDSVATRAGGILLGAQSIEVSVDRHANYHQQFVHTDPEGNLYCSVMRRKPIVAERLAFERWYHVALVIEMTGPSSTQRVYLDGELVDTAEGRLHDELSHLSYSQLGTGCITETTTCGWYGFNGLVDDCRFWDGALRDYDVRHLATYGHIRDSTPPSAMCSWSMRDVAVWSAKGKVSLVRSSSPGERAVRQVQAAGELSNEEIPIRTRRIRGCGRRYAWRE